MTGPRLLTGKNAPEKRVSGITPSRKITPNASSDLTRTAMPITTVAKAMPVSSWTPKARNGPHQHSKTPNGASTSMKTPQAVARRNRTNIRCAPAMWRASSGVAACAQ